MTELQQKQLDFLNDTINHFNSSNRGINPITHKCSYEFGCAIGRHLNKDLARIFDKRNKSVTGVWYELPKELIELGPFFLMQVQQLHDNEYNWNETGLSVEGNARVELIKKNFINNC